MTFEFGGGPHRVRGVEFLDNPAADHTLATRSLADVARANRLFGGTSAVLAELAPVLAEACRSRLSLTLLDVGTGAGDIPEGARRAAARVGVPLTTIGLELTEWLAASSRARSGDALAADARALPVASRSVDVVTCSQVLHHFEDPCARVVLAELNRVARRRVIVADIRRAWLAAGGLWLASWALNFHPVSRHDGVVSVLRGFRTRELSDAVHAATGVRPAVRNRRGFRVTASWSPT
ncbi:MAG TPA: methyltransferase domain-containing protein [Gemmatimonadaceae bacterium]|nr:methyltransferase domain-containing protein [Gemmatimonadaceae bacterium]